MARTAIPLSILAVAVLGACASRDPNYPDRPTPVATAPAVVATGQPVLIASGPVQPGTVVVPASSVFKPGSGVIESIAAVHITPAPSASAGAGAPERLAYRLTVRMDDGSMQAIDQTAREFNVGDRVSITSDGRVTRR
jgi:hypothetical protein